MNSPLFSIVMAARDAEDTIIEAIDSLLADTRVSVEIIVIDDASTDGTSAIVADYALRDPRVRLLTGDGHGPGAARNLGLEYMAGAWVTFADADDIVDTGYLDTVEAFVKRHRDTDLLAANVVRLAEGGRLDNHPLRFRFEGGSRVASLIDEPQMIHTSAAAGFFRKTTIEGARLRFHESTRWSEDADFVVRFLLCSARPTIGLVADATYGYRSTDPSSLSRSAWSQPGKYIEPFVNFYLPWLSLGNGRRWLENLVIYELTTYMDADRAPENASHGMPSQLRAACAELIAAVAAKVSRPAIDSYAITGLGLARRMMLVACGAPTGIISDYVVQYQRGENAPFTRHTYYFTGTLPREAWYHEQIACALLEAAIIDHRLFGKSFVQERICWLPAEGTIAAWLGEHPYPIRRYPGPPKRHAPPPRSKAQNWRLAKSWMRQTWARFSGRRTGKHGQSLNVRDAP